MTPSHRVWLRRSLLALQILLLIPIGWFMIHVFMPRGYTSNTAEVLPLTLTTGTFQTSYYAAPHPKGILIVATGDGGWSKQWEEPVAQHAAAVGYAVGGWDCRKFADTRKFNQAQLAEAFNAAVDAVRKRAKLPDNCPVWFTGWSTGAEWAVAAAASPHRPKHLLGVLAVAPGDRSRYGITRKDLLGLTATGPDSFSLAALAPTLHGVRIAEFSAALDPLDDAKWLDSLSAKTPHKLVKIPGVPHDMGRAGERFLSEFDMAIQWMLDTPVK
ncbi:MAG: hypothetical protein WCJ14_10150 [Verrucomicrobiota bacterium]